MNSALPTPYEKLIAHFEGSTTKAGKALGVSPSVVDNWRLRGIPPSRSLDVESATGGAVSAREVVEARRPSDPSRDQGRAAA